MRISWLKFEPRVSNFPLIKSAKTDFITASTKFFSLIFFVVTKVFFVPKTLYLKKTPISYYLTDRSLIQKNLNPFLINQS